MFDNKSPLVILKSLFKTAGGSHLYPLTDKDLQNEIQKVVVVNHSAYGELINLLVNRIIFNEKFASAEFWEKPRP